MSCASNTPPPQCRDPPGLARAAFLLARYSWYKNAASSIGNFPSSWPPSHSAPIKILGWRHLPFDFPSQKSPLRSLRGGGGGSCYKVVIVFRQRHVICPKPRLSTAFTCRCVMELVKVRLLKKDSLQSPTQSSVPVLRTYKESCVWWWGLHQWESPALFRDSPRKLALIYTADIFPLGMHRHCSVQSFYLFCGETRHLVLSLVWQMGIKSVL